MKLSFFNSLVLILSLLVQSASGLAVDDCSMPDDRAAMPMSMDAHDQHDMHMSEAEPLHDCCEQTCECVMASNPFVLAFENTLKGLRDNGQAFDLTIRSISLGFPDSIYRPPNFA